jgi:hypothetical protein
MDRVNAMNLAIIRKAAQMTQVEVARKLGVGQGVVSRLEHRDDMLLSTLYDYLMATGAEGASIVVVVHGHRIELDLSGLRNAPPEQQSALANPSSIPGDTALERVHLAAYGQGWYAYARLRSWIAACHSRGTFRGTVFWLIPAQRVPSVRSTVLSVQLARSVHEAVLLETAGQRFESAHRLQEVFTLEWGLFSRLGLTFRLPGSPWSGCRGLRHCDGPGFVVCPVLRRALAWLWRLSWWW